MTSMLQQIIQGMGTKFSSPGTMGDSQDQQATAAPTSLSGTIMGGGSVPMTSNASPNGNMGLNGNFATNTGITQSSPLSSLAEPSPQGQQGNAALNHYDISRINDPSYERLHDPFNVLVESDLNNGYDYGQSPGFQQYGQTWANLLSSMDKLQQRAQHPSEDDTTAYRQFAQQNPDIVNSPKYAAMSGGSGILNANSGITPQAEQDFLNPLGNASLDTGFANQIGRDYLNYGDFGRAADEAAPVLAKTFGLDTANPETGQYGKAYTTDVLQNENRNEYKSYLQDIHHDTFSSLLGGLGKAGAYFLAGAGPGMAAGGGAAAGSSGFGLGNFGLSSDISSGSNLFGDIAHLPGFVSPSGASAPSFNANVFSSPLTLTDAIVNGTNFNGDVNPYAKTAKNSWAS